MYRGNLIHDTIELLQCLDERGNPIDENNRVICAAESGRHALDGRSNSTHLRARFLCGFKFSGCIYRRDVWGIELVGWGFLIIPENSSLIWMEDTTERTSG